MPWRTSVLIILSVRIKGSLDESAENISKFVSNVVKDEKLDYKRSGQCGEDLKGPRSSESRDTVKYTEIYFFHFHNCE